MTKYDTIIPLLKSKRVIEDRNLNVIRLKCEDLELYLGTYRIWKSSKPFLITHIQVNESVSYKGLYLGDLQVDPTGTEGEFPLIFDTLYLNFDAADYVIIYGYSNVDIDKI